jgi:hypothetical protein
LRYKRYNVQCRNSAAVKRRHRGLDVEDLAVALLR